MSSLAALRLLLAIAYPLLAHWASVDGSGIIALLALADLAVIVLLLPLADRRAWAWMLLALIGLGLWALHGSNGRMNLTWGSRRRSSWRALRHAGVSG